MSSALTDTPTGSVYQPLFPFGVGGDTLIVVVGGADSAGLSMAEMFNRNRSLRTALGVTSAPTAGRVAVMPAARTSPPAAVNVATMAVPLGAKRPNRSPACTGKSTSANEFNDPGVSDSTGDSPTTV